jgi:hypothetical protein
MSIFGWRLPKMGPLTITLVVVFAIVGAFLGFYGSGNLIK